MKRSCVAIALLLFASVGVAEAQVIKLNGASKMNANGSVTPTLSWCTEATDAGEAPNSPTCANPGPASACTASGAWTGTKGASGSQAQAAVTTTAVYSLSCTWPGADSFTIGWSAPTTNTDGTTLTDLGGYTILYGTSASMSANQRKDIPTPGATSATIGPGLAPGTWYFVINAYNTGGVESAKVPSPPASKTLTAGATVAQAFKVTFPNPPVLTSVQ